MLRRSPPLQFRMNMGRMEVDYKMLSRDLKRSVSVEGAIVDPRLSTTVAPLHWLEALRSSSARLPKGYYQEAPVKVKIPEGVGLAGPLPSLTPNSCASELVAQTESDRLPGEPPISTSPPKAEANGIRAGPLVMYIVGQTVPVVLNVDFVEETSWPGMNGTQDCDLRLGMDAISQCSLFSELLPGGLLATKGTAELRKQGMVCGLASSPFVSRPYHRMKNMFMDELQRGTPLQEFVGYNPRNSLPWRYSQNNKNFRQGIWKEITKKNELHQGYHHHSSWQKSPQQSVPEVRHMAPSP